MADAVSQSVDEILNSSCYRESVTADLSDFVQHSCNTHNNSWKQTTTAGNTQQQLETDNNSCNTHNNSWKHTTTAGNTQQQLETDNNSCHTHNNSWKHTTTTTTAGNTQQQLQHTQQQLETHNNSCHTHNNSWKHTTTAATHTTTAGNTQHQSHRKGAWLFSASGPASDWLLARLHTAGWRRLARCFPACWWADQTAAPRQTGRGGSSCRELKHKTGGTVTGWAWPRLHLRPRPHLGAPNKLYWKQKFKQIL